MKIHNKLFSVFIIFAAVLVSAIVGFIQWSLDKGMIDYVNQREVNALKPFMLQLTRLHQQEGDWQELYLDHRLFERMLKQSLKGTDFALPPPGNRPPPRLGENTNLERRAPPPPRGHRKERLLKKGSQSKLQQNSPMFSRKRPPVKQHPVSYALLDAGKNYVVGDHQKSRQYSYSPLFIDDKVIGYLAISKRNRLVKGYELDFVEQQKDDLWYIALAVMLLVLLVTFPFARHLLSPLDSLTKGMHKLTQGHYKTRLENKRKDEFSQLSRDFNELAKTLMENENARKRWLANISHELRTPVAILKGELEAVIDGVRALSIEQIHSAHQEVSHLQCLIADLHALTSTDIGGMSYRKTSLDLVRFIDDESNKLQGYLNKAGLELVCNISVAKAMVFADQTRLCQLLDNLINNCIKYAATATKVELSLKINTTLNQVNLVVEDNGIGVEDKHLALLFEHLYRVDDSRNRKTGGSGLGLSICAHIVQAHQGSIVAKTSSLGGLAIHICMPLQ